MNWDQGFYDAPQSFWDQPTLAASSTTTTRSRMTHQAYYPTRAAEHILWLENFRNKLTGHAATLGITLPRCEGAIADARWVIYILGSWLPAVRDWQKGCTAAAEQSQFTDGTAALTLPVFTPPALPAAAGGQPAVVARPGGAINRIFDIIAEIKEADGYTPAIGQDIGAIGAGKTPPDFATLQPLLKANVSGGKVEIDWSWQGNSQFLDQLEIQVDRGTGWQILTFDSTPGYTDTTAHPATLTRWKYRAIYRVNDQQVGLWSAEVSVTVG